MGKQNKNHIEGIGNWPKFYEGQSMQGSRSASQQTFDRAAFKKVRGPALNKSIVHYVHTTDEPLWKLGKHDTMAQTSSKPLGGVYCVYCVPPEHGNQKKRERTAMAIMDSGQAPL